MTTTMEPDTTTVEGLHDNQGNKVPTEGPLTVQVGDITITAASEEEALRKYKRLVRAEALRAQIDNDWCDTGTNERLERLGLRRKGDGVTIRVRVVAERVAYMTLDVDSREEADQVLASGEDPELLALVTTLVGRGWRALVVESAPNKTGGYRVGDPDDTTAGLRIGNVAYIPPCEGFRSGQGYCTKARGHADQGDRQHVVGNGTTITAVWDDEPGSDEPVIGEVFSDYVRTGRCGDRGDDHNNPHRYVCTRLRGHDGQHVAATSDRWVVGIWDRED